jgi:eukaryotic-like serine/threonine-protein kinase
MSRESEIIGEYRLEKFLGEGGVGQVYRAEHTTSGQIVALKLISPGPGTRQDVIRRFESEARIMEKLRHPNIIRLLDSGQLGQDLFLSLEYMPRGNLRQWLARRNKANKPIGIRDAAYILQSVGAGLDYAHQKGIIHRDIKLENILIDK